MPIAYLVNQYPHTSHSFIRREIAAVEGCGVEVRRYCIRPHGAKLVDPADHAEVQRTRSVLASGKGKLLRATLGKMIRSPLRFWRALRTTVRLGRRSDRGLLRHLAYLAEACVLERWLAEEGATHLHAHFGTNSAAVAMLVRVLGGPPYSFTVHGPEEFDRPELLSLPAKIAAAKFVVAISEFGRSQLYRWTEHARWPDVHVVRCGVDQMFLDAQPTPVSEAPRLVCVGRLCEQKGQLLLVEAVAQLAGEGVNLELVLVGDGPMRPDIEKLIERFNLHKVVRILGWCGGAEVRREVQAARALVLPSFAEGLPVVIMEALGLGRPVISTYVAGIPELVQPGRSGWLVPASSIDGLKHAIREVLTASPQQLTEMGRAGASAVAELHDIRKEAPKLVKLFSAEASKAPVAPVESCLAGASQ